MIDPKSDILEGNLSYLPSATQQALRAATAQPPISLQDAGPLLRASVKTDDGRWVAVHRADDPRASSAKAAAKFAATNPPLVVVIGLGLGYLLDALDETPATTRVLAIEPLPGITRAMLARRDWSTWLSSGRLTIVAGPDYTGSAEVWGLFGRGAATPPTIMSPMIEREFPEEATRAKKLVGQIVAGAKANEEARRHFAGRYLLNTLTNVPMLAKEGDSASLFGAFSRVPAIVVGAGPSLDKTLREIAKLEGRVLIIAVDTALRPLLAAGIRPHLVVSVDPSELNSRHLRDLGDCRGAWLVAEASVDPNVFPQFAGRTFTFKVSQHHPWPWLEDNGVGRGTLRAWGSVLTTAFDLACRAGCDPIVFAGADLAYSDGLQYCRNTTYEEKWRDFPTDAARAELFKTYLADRPHLTQPDVHGGEVVTMPHFVQFRDWIVSRANEAADRRVVNATGGGILHGGRITQTDFSVLHLPKAKHELNLHRRLRAAWEAGLEIRRPTLGYLASAIRDSASLPMDAWLDFGGDTASADQIANAVGRAIVGLDREAMTGAYLSERAADADAHATTIEQAQQWIHPNYARARVQAEAQQAHVLLDFMERAHATIANPDLKTILEAATSRPTRLRILDVGCGVGRTMEPLVSAGHDVDGVDISQQMVELAKQNPQLAGSRFFVSDGDDCGGAPDGAYDIATIHLTLHLIKSRTVRLSLLKAMARALKPGGMFFAQMPFYPDCTAAAVPNPHSSWLADVVDGTPALPHGHVWPTADALPEMLRDFNESFRDVRLQFVNFPSGPRRKDAASATSVTHILVSGSPDGTLAARIYALQPAPPARRDAVLAFPGTQRHS